MRFDWDARKSDRNLADRGFDFEFATQIFDGRTLEREDTRRDYGERRVIAIGMAQDVALTVIYTDRVETGGGVTRRIISARVSHRHEREVYKDAISQE
ncbi:MAG: BrnT family toxin [Vicinamibacterales bacterium]|nr:BrnT family toxin [Vicinamibacterales bacterium]